MKMIRLLLLSVIVALCGCTEQKMSEPKQAAVEAAEQWLKLMDMGEYCMSWEESASFFRGVVSKDQWDHTAAAVRKPLGDLVSREVKSTKYMTEVPGAPDGEYVVIQFNTSYQNKKTAVETVTPMKDTDGVWRVSGFFIK